jgi:AcrR family transcriptional regulator
MSGPSSTPRRYDSSRRQAKALQTRERILASAQARFESDGWSATTMAAVAAHAEVSVKTIEAQFKTKAALLAAVVDWAIRGDATDVPIIQREAVAAMRQAPDAPAFLALHAYHVRTVHQRSARVLAAVEHAASEDPAAHQLWQRILTNRQNGTRAPAQQLLTLPGRRPTLTLQHASTVFWLTTDWAYWRALHDQQALTPDQIEAWTNHYYRAMLL